MNKKLVNIFKKKRIIKDDDDRPSRKDSHSMYVQKDNTKKVSEERTTTVNDGPFPEKLRGGKKGTTM